MAAEMGPFGQTVSVKPRGRPDRRNALINTDAGVYQPSRCRSNRRGYQKLKGIPQIMKTLDTIMNVISFLLLAIVLYALAPILLKLLAVANGVHHLLGV
jgi:hypothetical protein